MKKTDIKLSFMDTKFIENGPATVCKIVCEFYVPIYAYNLLSLIKKRFPLVETDYYDVFNKISIRFTSTGIAKLHHNDNDNPVIGKRVSESRAKLNAYQLTSRILSVVSDYLDNICVQCDNSSYIFEYQLATTETLHINELLYWEDEYDNLYKNYIELNKSLEQINEDYPVYTIEDIKRALKFVGIPLKEEDM